nr:MAG TPA: hypothetical protein [Caudoviricetes sp.]
MAVFGALTSRHHHYKTINHICQGVEKAWN